MPVSACFYVAGIRPVTRNEGGLLLPVGDRSNQLESLERWCCQATTWQQLRVALPIVLLLGIGAGLIADLAPCPTPDEVCDTITYQIKIQVGPSLLPAHFSVEPA